jgi:hypothetical protein
MASVVIGYDLHGAKPDIYEALDEQPTKFKFVKSDVDTTWSQDYPVEPTGAAAAITARLEFQIAAAAAKVTTYTLDVFSSLSSIQHQRFKR